MSVVREGKLNLGGHLLKVPEKDKQTDRQTDRQTKVTSPHTHFKPNAPRDISKLFMYFIFKFQIVFYFRCNYK